MGKIRVKTIGDEQAEKEQQVEARKRAEERRKQRGVSDEVKKEASAEDPEGAGKAGDRRNPSGVQPSDTEIASSSPEASPRNDKEEKKQKKEKFVQKKANPRSKKYTDVSGLVDRNKRYTLKEALDLLPKLKTASFDETVELHINTIEQGVSGNLTLPHGTGKAVRVRIVNHSKDPKDIQELVMAIEGGKIAFDVLIATPDSMPHLAKIARFLGPKGLMPNPKNGTVTPKPEEVAKRFEGGQINYKTEAKAPIIHLVVGKVSFGIDKLNDNIKAVLSSLPREKVTSVTLKSTMSPGIKILM